MWYKTNLSSEPDLHQNLFSLFIITRTHNTLYKYIKWSSDIQNIDRYVGTLQNKEIFTVISRQMYFVKLYILNFTNFIGY